MHPTTTTTTTTTRSQPITTTTASTTSVFRGGITRNSDNDNNPFLETPARKLFKQHHHDGGSSSSGGAFSGSGYSHQQNSGFAHGLSGGNRAFATGVAAAIPSLSSSKKPQRLVLTRVMPSSITSVAPSTTSIYSSAATPESGVRSAPVTVTPTLGGGRKGALPASSLAEPSYVNTFATSSPFTATTTRTTTTTTMHVKDSHGFAIPSAPAARPSEKILQAHHRQHQQQRQEQHMSTTPKGAPNQHYFDLLAKSLESAPAPKLNLGLVSAKGEVGGMQAREQEQEQEQEQSVKTVPPANSRMMDFARKSIMQHSAAAPGSIFRKLGNKAGSQQLLTHSQARLLINKTLLQSSTSTKSTPPVQTAATKATTAETESPQDRMTADNSKELMSAKEGVNRREPIGDLAFRFVSTPKPTTIPAAAAATAATTTFGPLTSETSAPSHMFARSVLDFSGSSEPKVPRKATLNTTAAIPITSNNNSNNNNNNNNNNVNSSNSFSKFIYPNKAHQPPSMATTLMNISSAAENRTPPTITTTTTTATTSMNMDVEMGSAGADDSSGSQRSSPAFDIRTALRMDSTRTQYQLPSLIASLSPPPSPRRRPTPYSVPSANDREALRIRRMPRFKARPLNPKIFTGAGDLGLPKIQKPALTVPVSPVFSRRKRTKDVVVSKGLTKEKDVSTSAAATRLKEMVEAGAVKKQKLKQQKQQEEQASRRQAISAGGRQPGVRVVQSRVVNHAQASQRDIGGNKSKDKNLGGGGGGMGGGARRIEVLGAGRGAQNVFEPSLKPVLTTTSLVVPSVDQTRPEADVVGGVLESDMRLHHHHRSYDLHTSSAAATGGVSRLRQPTAAAGGGGTTQPVPFNFATTELQRKRMLYQPTPSDYSLIATSASSSSGAVVESGSVTGSTNGLSLEDLMPDS
ncbi:hypothetical protein BGZ47_005280 [Haplosporangium gracile]|nr:hypothetical protein BGZ47_005280 [Haplosporangium gracile]